MKHFIFVFALLMAFNVFQTNAIHCTANRYQRDPRTGLCPLKSLIDDQIHRELNASYSYMQIGSFFAHEDYQLPYFSKYFIDNAQEELKHAQKLIEYQVLRGAHVNFRVVGPPANKIFNCGLEALEDAYKLEFEITEKIEQIWQMADQLRDIHLADFLEANFVTEQYESLKKLKDMIGTLSRMSTCACSNTTPLMSSSCCCKLSEFQFDKLVMKEIKQ